jgi:hypothetical protein
MVGGDNNGHVPATVVCELPYIDRVSWMKSSGNDDGKPTVGIKRRMKILVTNELLLVILCFPIQALSTFGGICIISHS